jgi:integrase
MGVSVREKIKGSGEYWIFVLHDGQRMSKKVGEKEVADKLKKMIEAKIILGDFSIEQEKAVDVTFKEYASKWFEDYNTPPFKKPSTCRKRQGLLDNYLYPWFGHYPLQSITRQVIRDKIIKVWRNGYRKQYKQIGFSVVQNCLSLLSVIFNHAVDDGLIEINPVTRIKKNLGIKIPPPAAIQPFSRDELRAVIGEVPEELMAVFMVLGHAGLRVSEATALQWQDLDLENSHIHVRHNWSDSVLTTTKSSRRRIVDMTDELSRILQDLSFQTRIENLKRGRDYDSWKEDFVFTDDNGQPLDRKPIERALNKACDDLKLERRRIHDLRHSYASILLSVGAPLVYVKEQLGHASIKTTGDTYGHFIPSDEKKFLAAF